MSQIAFPISDVFVVNWLPIPVWNEVNQPGGAGQVSSVPDPNGATFKVNLAHLGRPGSGPQVLTVRLKQSGTPTAWAGVILWQGSTLIAAANFELTADFNDYTIVLTDAEIATITDYCDLQVQVSTASPVTCCCCPGVAIPPTLYATLTGTAECACVSGGSSIALLYNSATGKWTGTGPLGGCGRNITISVYCNDASGHPCANAPACTFMVDVVYLDGCTGNGTCIAVGPMSCSPFQISFSLELGPSCGCTSAGGYNITITQ